MKFVNVAGSSIAFELRGVKMSVAAGEVFEVEERLAYALPLMGLPVAAWQEPPAPELVKPEPPKAEPKKK